MDIQHIKHDWAFNYPFRKRLLIIFKLQMEKSYGWGLEQISKSEHFESKLEIFKMVSLG